MVIVAIYKLSSFSSKAHGQIRTSNLILGSLKKGK